MAFPRWYDASSYPSLSAAVAAVPDGNTLYLRPQTYTVPDGESLQIGNIRLLGDNAIGTVITGNVAGPLVDFGDGTGIVQGTTVEHLTVRNFHADGDGIRYCGRQGGGIENCIVSAKRIGIDLRLNVFSICVRYCLVVGQGNASGSVGILSSGAHLDAVDVTGWDHGVRAWGANFHACSMRFEVNKVGLILGIDADGITHNLYATSVDALTFEGNDTAIEIRSLVASTLNNFLIQGTTNAPSGQSLYGIRVLNGLVNSTIINGILSDSFSQAGMDVPANGEHDRATIEKVTVGNGFPGGDTWRMPSIPDGLTIVDCDNP